MNVTAQKFQSQYAPVCKSLAWSNHRTTLPQSRFARQLPQRGSRGGVRTIQRAARRPERWRAIFIAPTKAQNVLHSSIHRTTLPQSRIRSTAPSEREPGRGAYHSTHRPEAGTLRAIFIAPTKGGWHSTDRPETPTLRAIFIAPTKGGWHSTGRPETPTLAGDFHRPYERAAPFSRLCSRWPR